MPGVGYNAANGGHGSNAILFSANTAGIYYVGDGGEYIGPDYSS